MISHLSSLTLGEAHLDFTNDDVNIYKVHVEPLAHLS